MAKDDTRTVQLKHVRLSFTDTLNVAKVTVKDDPNATPKHTCNVILEKSDPHYAENDKKVRAAISAACEQEWKNPEKWKSIAEDNPMRVAYRKGERFKNKETDEVYQGYAGNMAISCAGPSGGKKRPAVWDRRKNRITNPEEMPEVAYGGSYADVIVSFYGTGKGGPGVFCTIEAIRSRQEGERIGGGGWDGDESAFDDLEDDESFDQSASSGGSDDPFA